MGIGALVVLALGLSMDAFAVSICKGLAIKKINFAKMMLVGLYFGLFQALMPLAGYLLGQSFYESIQWIDHWVAFFLLGAIGVNMLVQAVKSRPEEHDASLDFRSMLILAVATSIDALAVGVTFAFLEANIWLACGIIGCTTFLTSAIGVKIGHIFGMRYKTRAEIAGGVVLILLGIHILVEQLWR